MKPVSIIVTHYSQIDDFEGKGNSRSEMMKRSIKSLIDHTNYPAELIVIDNGGDDDDSDFLVDLARKGHINTYIRNKDNMHFGWGFNQGVKLATSDYVFLTCNDILFEQDWLSKTIEPLLKHPDKKWWGSPCIINEKYDLGEFDGYRLNTWAGSNCRLIPKSLYYDVGEYTTHHLAGSIWERKIIDEMGYVSVSPDRNYASDMARGHGLSSKNQIKVQKTLMNGQVLDFSHAYNTKVVNRGGKI